MDQLVGLAASSTEVQAQLQSDTDLGYAWGLIDGFAEEIKQQVCLAQVSLHDKKSYFAYIEVGCGWGFEGDCVSQNIVISDADVTPHACRCKLPLQPCSSMQGIFNNIAFYHCQWGT